MYSFAHFGNINFLSVGRLIKYNFGSLYSYFGGAHDQLRENCSSKSNNTSHDLMVSAIEANNLSLQTPALPSESRPESPYCSYSPEQSTNALVEYLSKILATVTRLHVNHSITIEFLKYGRRHFVC